jgi:hypothetical protein
LVFILRERPLCLIQSKRCVSSKNEGREHLILFRIISPGVDISTSYR